MLITEPLAILFLYLTVCVTAPMEEREQAKRLYIKARENEHLGEDAQGDLRRTVKNLVKRSLNGVDHKSRFQFQEFPLMISKTARFGKFVRNKTSEAFILLEKYLILVLTFPWKTEFHKLKTYSGFFQSKIKSHLEDPEMVFKLIGFREHTGGHSTLILRENFDLDLISDVAFECVVASVECELIVEYHRCIAEKGGDICDAVNFRLEGKQPEFSKKKARPHVGYVNLVSERACSDPGRALQQRGVGGLTAVNNATRGLPFIDEDFGANEAEVAPSFEMGTVDDHMLASLQKLKSQSQRSGKCTAPQSEEWSYVRDGLENKFGKRYYDGVRGDVINSNSRHDGPTPAPQERDDFSDEGIDVDETPRLAVKVSHVRDDRGRSPIHRTLMTSGYRSGQYSNIVACPPQNSPVLTCDAASILPGAEASSVATHSSGYVTQSTVPKDSHLVPRPCPGALSVATHSSGYVPQSPVSKFDQPMLRVRDSGPNGSRLTYGECSNNLSNIDRLSRGEASNDFRMEPLKNRGSNLTDGRMLNQRWNCKSCTMDNDPHSQICSICNKSRTNPLEIDGHQVGDSVRVCSECTLENKPGLSECVACNTRLAPTNINTYV